MKNIERRTFLRTAGGVFAAGLSGLAAPIGTNSDEPRKGRWKRAFMLGGLSKGSPKATFQLLKDAGFDGVELISPNELDLSEVLAARDETGLSIHGVSGSRHWQEPLSDPDPAGRRAGDGSDPPGIPRLQGLRRHHRAGRARRSSTARSATATPTSGRRRTSAS